MTYLLLCYFCRYYGTFCRYYGFALQLCPIMALLLYFMIVLVSYVMLCSHIMLSSYVVLTLLQLRQRALHLQLRLYRVHSRYYAFKLLALPLLCSTGVSLILLLWFALYRSFCGSRSTSMCPLYYVSTLRATSLYHILSLHLLYLLRPSISSSAFSST